jgi:hypothetical protein
LFDHRQKFLLYDLQSKERRFVVYRPSQPNAGSNSKVYPIHERKRMKLRDAINNRKPRLKRRFKK